MKRISYLDPCVSTSVKAIRQAREAQCWYDCLRMEDDGGPARDPQPLETTTWFSDYPPVAMDIA